MEYYSAIKKNEILLFVTCIDLDSIMINEISQRKTNTILSLLYLESKTKQKLSSQMQKTGGGCQRLSWV